MLMWREVDGAHADWRWAFLVFVPPHGSTPSIHVNQKNKFHVDWSSCLFGEASHVRMGGALPRWRPPPHSPLIQLKIRINQSEMNSHYMPHLSIKLGFRL